MPLLQALRYIAELLIRFIQVIVLTTSRSAVGLRKLVAVTRRQRTRGTAGAPALTRLFDLHAMTVTADLSLLVGLLWAAGAPSGPGWALAALLSVAATGGAVFTVLRTGLTRAVIGLGLVLRAVGTVLAAQWLTGAWPVLLVLTALVLPQWVLHLTAMGRQVPEGVRRRTVLSAAMAYGLLAGLFTTVLGLLAGWILPALPLWTAVVLLTVAAFLALRLAALPAPPRSESESESQEPPAEPLRRTMPKAAQPAPAQPAPSKPVEAPTVPIQLKPDGTDSSGSAPEGYHVYRPSSLE